MTKPFSERTIRLFRAVGYPENVHRSDDNETHQLVMATVGLDTKFWNSLRQDKFPSEYAETMDALRAALSENRGSYAAMFIARAMVRGNCLEPDVIASLDGWDRMMFAWREAGITPESAVKAVEDAGLGCAASVDTQALNGWLLDPLTAVDEGWNLARALFGEELVHAARETSSDFAAHEVLLGELFARAKPPVKVENLKQTPNVPHQLLPVMSPEDPRQQRTIRGYPVFQAAAEHFIVSFEYKSERHLFTTDYASGHMDRDSVLRFFDRFMLEAGRGERVFDLQLDVDYGFVVAQAEAASRLARELYIPLRACASDR
jgi:hypothetical protein